MCTASLIPQIHIKLKVRIVLSFQLPFTQKMMRLGIMNMIPHTMSTILLSFIIWAMKNTTVFATKTESIGSQKSMGVVPIAGVGPS